MVFGLYYYLDRRLVCLPLLNVNAEASIKELAAQVKLTQTYTNDTDRALEAVYAFPIPARAAVCSFAMIKEDNTRVVGLVQEKQEARETYNEAVSQGQQASLMEQASADVFQVSVGNIPAGQSVTIELVYATELSEDEENDSIRFHLPVHIGARYGKAPMALSPRNPFASSLTSPAFTSSSGTFLTLSISVESIAPISKIGCPSHTVSTELGPDRSLPNFKELPFSNYARVSLTSASPLDKDFVLTMKSAGLDAPRCVAELHPEYDTVGMALTFVPRFKLHDIARQEFIFLVDRSGSMDGHRIVAARKALVVLLRSLPRKDTLFQIISFGSEATPLWKAGSKPYNQETLEEATRDVDRMDANYGGTELKSALHACFATRKLDRPTSVLLLTDGEAWDLDAVLQTVKDAVATAPEAAPLRLSVLGIGDSVSTAMCEGVARVGHGSCILVGEHEMSFTGKLARLMKAAKSPVILNISVDWGRPLAEPGKAAGLEDDDFEMVEELGEKPKATLNVFDKAVNTLDVDDAQVPPPAKVILAAPPAVQQSPFKIRNLFPGVRLNLYAIMQGRDIPKTVTLRGSTSDGAEIELPISVSLSHLQNTPGAPPAIHALAARKIIQDLEDGQHALLSALANPDDADLLARTVKASIVRLGKTYSIASTHTSFVAVDESTPESLHLAVPSALSAASTGDEAKSVRARAFRRAPHPPPDPPAGSAPPPPPPGRRPAPPAPAAPAHPMHNYNYSSISSLILTAARSALPARSTGFQFVPQTPATEMVSDCLDAEDEADDDLADSSGLYTHPAAPSSPPPIDLLETLARLQSFDGRFSSEVFTFISLKTGLQAMCALFPARVGNDIIATVLAMAVLSTGLGADVERDAWEDMYEKAKEYVEDALDAIGVDESVESLQARVVTMLA
ncbi:von Willebrand factor type A domain-containing protein [Mycena filopes]|nr:von Willebrand factor type A domain-containing protein [Mycena filopes]